MPYSTNIAGGNIYKCEVTWRGESSAYVIPCVAHSIRWISAEETHDYDGSKSLSFHESEITFIFVISAGHHSKALDWSMKGKLSYKDI